MNSQENIKELERINKRLTPEQRKLLEQIIPDYNTRDVVELEELLADELQTKGFGEDNDINEYGAKILDLIDIVVDAY